MDEENWNLLTVARNGTVSLIKELSETKAKELADSLLYRQIFPEGGGWQINRDSEGDIVRTEAFE